VPPLPPPPPAASLWRREPALLLPPLRAPALARGVRDAPSLAPANSAAPPSAAEARLLLVAAVDPSGVELLVPPPALAPLMLGLVMDAVLKRMACRARSCQRVSQRPPAPRTRRRSPSTTFAQPQA
jgi:hypothetical protein